MIFSAGAPLIGNTGAVVGNIVHRNQIKSWFLSELRDLVYVSSVFLVFNCLSSLNVCYVAVPLASSQQLRNFCNDHRNMYTTRQQVLHGKKIMQRVQGARPRTRLT